MLLKSQSLCNGVKLKVIIIREEMARAAIIYFAFHL